MYINVYKRFDNIHSVVVEGLDILNREVNNSKVVHHYDLACVTYILLKLEKYLCSLRTGKNSFCITDSMLLLRRMIIEMLLDLH